MGIAVLPRDVGLDAPSLQLEETPTPVYSGLLSDGTKVEFDSFSELMGYPKGQVLTARASDLFAVIAVASFDSAGHPMRASTRVETRGSGHLGVTGNGKAQG